MTTATRKTIRSLNDVQREAVLAHMGRRIAMLHALFHQCPDRRCRRMRSCVGADRACLKPSLPPLSERAKRRLVRDLKRSPPRL